MMRAARALAAAALAGSCFFLAGRASAVLPPAQARQDAKRFGLDRFAGPVRRTPAKSATAAFNAYNKSHGGKWAVRFDTVTGAPSALIKGRSAPRPGKPEEAAAAFLGEAREFLHIDPATLNLEKRSSDRGLRHVLYRQTYRGLPVEFARVKVHLDADGSVVGVHSGYSQDLSLDVTPGLTAAQAAEAVRREVGGPAPGGGTLVVFPDRQTGQARRRPLALWRYYVDALSGAVLFRYNDLRFLSPPPICLTSGTVTGMVFDVDPNSTPGPVARPLDHLNVYVGDGNTFSPTYDDATFGPGFYCSPAQGKVFTQLQGSFVSVGNFRGASLHYDNGGGVWRTVQTQVSSPHPYPNGAVLISTIDISGVAPGAVKFLPVFSNFNVGAVTSGGVGEGADITDDDELTVLDSAGNRAGYFVGDRGAFNGIAVPGTSMFLKLTSNAYGQNYGYDVSLSSYLVLSSPQAAAPDNDVLLSTASAAGGLRSEINLYYHLNLAHDYFMADVDASSAAFIGNVVPAMAFVGPDIVNAFYDPDHDDFIFGDYSDSAPSDLFTDDATVPHHEFTHYVVEKIWSIYNFGQGGAISEGNADYFSASELNDPSIGLYANGVLGNNTPLRQLDSAGGSDSCGPSPAVLGGASTPWMGEIHCDSRYFSQSLWDIRKDRIAQQGFALGRSCADELAFQALLFFPESFLEYEDAMEMVDSLGLAHSCGGANSAHAQIVTRFAQHGLPMGGVGSAINSGNNGFQTALDVSTMSTVSEAIYPAGQINYYTFGAGPGPIAVTMQLPPSPDGALLYQGYSLTLFDRNHNVVAAASPPFDGVNTNSGYCGDDDCTTTQATVALSYDNPSANQFYVAINGGQTASGASNSGVNSTSPYALTFSFQKPGAAAASLVSASFDNDVIGFSVAVATFVQTQVYNFAYAQLRDQSLQAVANTVTHVPAQPGDYLVLLSSANGFGLISGQAQLVPGFAARFPSLGTVYVEVFGYNVFGSTISLGVSQPLNLAASQTSLTAWNNVLNPLQGGKATVKYEIQTAGHVTIKLYTLSGALVQTLFDGDAPAGEGSVDWAGLNMNGATVASGVYLVRMKAPGVSKTQKIVVVK